MNENVLIHSDNGLPVKLRASPSRACATWWEIPPGTSAVRLGSDGPWSRLEATDGKGISRSGWMQSSFVKSTDGSAGENTPNEPDRPAESTEPAESAAASQPPSDPAASSALLSRETVIRMMAILAVIEKQLDALYELLGGRG